MVSGVPSRGHECLGVTVRRCSLAGTVNYITSKRQLCGLSSQIVPFPQRLPFPTGINKVVSEENPINSIRTAEIWKSPNHEKKSIISSHGYPSSNLLCYRPETQTNQTLQREVT